MHFHLLEWIVCSERVGQLASTSSAALRQLFLLCARCKPRRNCALRPSLMIERVLYCRECEQYAGDLVKYFQRLDLYFNDQASGTRRYRMSTVCLTVHPASLQRS